MFAYYVFGVRRFMPRRSGYAAGIRSAVSVISFLSCFLLAAAVFAEPALWSERNQDGVIVPGLQQFNEELLHLTQTLLPAVVSLKVYSTKEGEAALPENHPAVPEPDGSFVTGSGFIIRADGLMLTNYHVIEDSENIEVLLYDGTQTTAKIVGRDPSGDLALLQIVTERPLPVMPLGNSAGIQVGEFVVAIGSPFGFEHTVTFGIISAIKRNFLRSGLVGGYIQTDAAINTGNSGGPLVNMRGEAIGINTATIGRGELGFAIPIDAVKDSLPQLYALGHVTRGWLGIRIRPVDRTRAAALGLETAQGVYVHDVLRDQPAHRAGLVVGDVIVRFNGQTVATPFDLQSVVAATPVGKKVQVEFLRNQSRHTVEVALGIMPEEQ